MSQHQFLLPCSFHVATPRPCRDTPNSCPCRDIKIMSRLKTSMSQPNHVATQKLMSRPGAKENMSRAQRPCRGHVLVVTHCCARSRPALRACTPSLSQQHLLCHNQEPKMGSSPSIWSPAPFLFFFFFKNPLVASTKPATPKMQ